MARIRFNSSSLLALTGLFGATVIGGGVLFILGAPMPFLIGGIIGAALFVWSYETPDRLVPKMSPLYPFMCHCHDRGDDRQPRAANLIRYFV